MPHIDLLELPYFEGISSDAMLTLVDLMRPIQFQAGDVIMVEGAQRQPLYVATTGTLLVSKRGPNGEERPLAELEAPTLFGEIELFCQIPAVCSTRAIDPVTAFVLDRATFDKLFAVKNQALLQFTFNVARVACHRLAVADELLTQVLDGINITAMRHDIWTRMIDTGTWTNTTGAFRRPK